jgi:hypothetical protein
MQFHKASCKQEEIEDFLLAMSLVFVEVEAETYVGKFSDQNRQL